VNIHKQLTLVTRLLAIACITSMVLCYKLWLVERNFPTTPVFNFLPIINHPFDYLLPILCIISLILIIIKPIKKFILIFLITAILLALFDLNRWQPWYYQYIMMFFVLSFYSENKSNEKHQKAILLCFKIMMAGIYFWSGLQKFNPNFVSDTYLWLMEPSKIYLGANFIDKLDWLAYAFPVIETLTGISLLITPIKKAGAVLAIIMHLFILFTLSPLGHNYNQVVWPWNIFMIIINYILCFKVSASTKNDWKGFNKFNSIRFVLIVFILFPLFNFFNKWDSYLSHNLYSGNTSGGLIYVSDSVKQKLPVHIKKYFNESNTMNIKYWSMMELGVPPYPEKRNFEAVTKTLYPYADDKSEIYLEYTPKIKVEF